MKKMLWILLASAMAFAAPCETYRGYEGRVDETLGTVVGGIVGGLLGHQLGKGRGKTAATIGGAVAGAVLGQKIVRGDGYGYEPRRPSHAKVSRGHGRRYSKGCGRVREWRGCRKGHRGGHRRERFYRTACR